MRRCGMLTVRQFKLLSPHVSYLPHQNFLLYPDSRNGEHGGVLHVSEDKQFLIPHNLVFRKRSSKVA